MPHNAAISLLYLPTFLYLSDEQISDMSQQSLVSALDGNKSQDLHLSLRLSVCEGVKVMYSNYQNKKWSQVNVNLFLKTIFQHLNLVF